MDSMSGWEAQRAQLRPPPVYPREFTCTDVEVYCAAGSKATMTLKKTRKDKRESHNARPLLDDNSRKLKERPSWLSISRQPSSSLSPTGSWRQVTCNLQDDAGQAILRLYTEDQHLQHLVQVDALLAPSLRIVDPTLLMRRHVLAIHAHTSPNTTSAPSASPPTPPEPIYLSFRDRDTLNTWLILLRSFARPDIRPFPPLAYSPPSPSPYRIWRQLQVTIIAGRKFPTGFLPEKNSSDECTPGRDKELGPDKDVFAIYLEVVVNGMPVGRTGTKQVPGPPWHAERITAHDPDLGGGNWAGSGGVGADLAGAVLDPNWGMTGATDMNAGLLEIRVWRERPALFGRPAMHIATVPVDLGPFRRGEPVKAWWPGYPAAGRGFQDGELMLEIKFDEEIVMPLDMYQKMKDILARRNYFELWQDLVHRIPVPNSVSHHLISLAQHHATLAPHLSALARAEINDPRASPSTLFRGNTTLTRAAEAAMSLLGARGFLENSVGGVVRRIYKDKVIFDLGASGSSGVASAGGVTAVDSADLMAHWLQELWNSIWRARGDCPEELRQLFYQIRTQVDQRWGNSPDHADLKYQAISAFLFLRFFIPALLRPDQNSLAIGAPPEGVERSLKSLARALQSLANLNTSVQREEFMRSIKTFNEDNVDAMIDYLIFVSTPSERLLSSPSIHPNVHHQYHHPPRESAIHTALRVRSSTMSAIERESLGVLPHMSDEARDLAAIASAVVRNARAPKELQLAKRFEVAQDVGPMDETLELELDEDDSARIYGGAPSTRQPAIDKTSYSESQLDALRFVKACFDAEGEAMRRVSPQIKKKQARRRRRPKMDEKLAPMSEERLGVTTSASAGPSSTSSIATKPPKSPEIRRAMQFPPALTIPGMSTYGSLPIPITELGAKPEMARQMSHTIATESAAIDTVGSKKRKGMFRFMRGI
ncbi:Ras GTPase-activating-like protein ngap [Ceratobasidium sp. AG-Ba]|nr:Ras GTPase-activating-like protein ngap [Ceratobasidium sp. AG-Ba]